MSIKGYKDANGNIQKYDINSLDAPFTAEVGQVLVVESVDENGYPNSFSVIDQANGVEITDVEPTKESTVLTVNPNAEEVNLYTAEEIDEMLQNLPSGGEEKGWEYLGEVITTEEVVQIEFPHDMEEFGEIYMFAVIPPSTVDFAIAMGFKSYPNNQFTAGTAIGTGMNIKASDYSTYLRARIMKRDAILSEYGFQNRYNGNASFKGNFAITGNSNTVLKRTGLFTNTENAIFPIGTTITVYATR